MSIFSTIPLLLKREFNQNLLKAIQTAGACDLCILRYLGVRESAIFEQLQNNFPVKLGNSEREKENKKVKLETDICPCCLGILQLDRKELSANAFECFKQKKYELKEQKFSMFIKLPPQLIIRHQSMLHYITNALENEVHDVNTVLDVKEIFKILVRSSFENISGLTFETSSPLALELDITHHETDEDYKFLTEIEGLNFHVHKSTKKGHTIFKGASVEKITRAVAAATSKDFIKSGQSPPPRINSLPLINLDFTHSQIYVAGRYCKLKRNISNSIWIIKGKKITEDSMEELIGNFLSPVFHHVSHKFSSSGREDSDVLMLGTGRPFYFELVNPIKTVASNEEMAELQRLINDNVDSKISVQDLQLVSREQTDVLRHSAAEKKKSYRCMVLLEELVDLSKLEKVSKMKEIAVQQRNPTRVPRRSDLVRDKIIHSINITADEIVEGKAKSVQVDLVTSAGTYVKEFMHGDNGRTVPNLWSLLECKSASVISLDVLHVYLDWPPSLT